MIKRLVFVTLVVGCFLVPITGRASLQKGLFKFGFDSTLFRFGLVNYDPHGPDEKDFDNISFGIGIPNGGLIFGYCVVNGLVLGARVSVGLQGYDDYIRDEQVVIWSAMPFLEYIFLRRVFRPFFMVTLGMEGVNAYRHDDTWWWAFKAAGGGGAHIFAHPRVSIDFTLLAGFAIGHGENVGLPNPGPKYEHWRFMAECLLGVSGWF